MPLGWQSRLLPEAGNVPEYPQRTGRMMSVSPTGAYVAVCAGEYLYVYQIDTAAWSTALVQSATGTVIQAVEWSPDEQAIVVVGNKTSTLTPYAVAYRFTAGVGITSVIDSSVFSIDYSYDSDATIYDVRFSPDGSKIAFAVGRSTGYIADEPMLLLQWSIAGFGTRLNDPGDLDGGSNNGTYRLIWSPDGTQIFGCAFIEPTTYRLFSIDVNASGFTGSYTLPGSVPPARCRSIDITDAGDYVAVCFDPSPYAKVYPWDGSAFGTAVSDPGTAISNATYGPVSVEFSPDDDYIAFGTSYTYSSVDYYGHIYAWSAGFSTEQAPPSTSPPTGRGITVSFTQEGNNNVIVYDGTPIGATTPYRPALFLTEQTIELSHTTDAIFRGSLSKTHSTDAILRKQQSATHTTDAYLTDGVVERTTTHTSDAVLRKEQSVTHTTDAYLQSRGATEHTTDAVLFLEVTIAHTTDAYLEITEEEAQSESSSCTEGSLDEYGRIPIGVDQTQGGELYPFIDPSPDIRNLLADAYLEYEDPSDYDSAVLEFEPPFHIAWLYGLGCVKSIRPGFANAPTHDVDIVIRDNTDAIVFDSTLADEFYDKEWGDRFRILEWRTDTAICRIVTHTKIGPDDSHPAASYDVHIEPINGVLDSRVWYRVPKRVKSITANLQQFLTTGVVFSAGYNLVLAEKEQELIPGSRFIHELEFSVIPGRGLGRYPGCEEPEALIRTINQIGPDEYGNFVLSAKDCFWLRQPTLLLTGSPRELVLVPNKLQLGNNCKPCCECEDYVDTYQYLLAIRAGLVEIGGTVDETIDQLEELIDKWNEQKECIESKPLQFHMMATACPYIDVAVQFTNQTQECVGPVTVQMSFAASGGEGDLGDGSGDPCTAVPAIAANSSYRKTSVPKGFGPFTLDGVWPEYSVTWWQVNPRDFVLAKFRLKLPDDSAWTVEGTLTGLINAEEIDQTITTSATTDCPDNCNG